MKDAHYLSYYLFCSFSMSFSPLLGFYRYKKMVSIRYFPVLFFFLFTLVFNFQVQQNLVEGRERVKWELGLAFFRG